MKLQLRLTQMFTALSLLFLAAFSVSAAVLETLDVHDLETDCNSFLVIDIGTELRGTVNDDDRRDEVTFVLSDYFGTVLLYDPQTITVGRVEMSFDLSGLNAPAAARPFTLSVFDTDFNSSNAAEAERYPLLGSIRFDPADFGVCGDLPFSPGTETFENPSFSDGRLNDYDMAAPVVVFGHDYEMGRGLVVYSPDGALLLVVRPENLANIADCPEENTLIVSSGDVALYRLRSCQYQLNAPSLDGSKTYVLIFDSFYNTGYISYEE